MDRRGRLTERRVRERVEAFEVDRGALPLRIHRRMHFEPHLAVHARNLHRLVDEPHRRADLHQREQCFDVLGIHADAAMRDGHAHRDRIVRAVYEIGARRDVQAHRVVAERIVRARGHDLRQRIAALRVFLAHRFRRAPGRILALVDDLRLAERRVPVHLADAHRKGDDLRNLALLRRREVVQPVFRQIDDDALARTAGQQALSGNHDGRSLARQPGVDARIRAQDLLVAEPVTARQVGQGVFVVRGDGLDVAEHQGARIDERELGRTRRRAAG